MRKLPRNRREIMEWCGKSFRIVHLLAYLTLSVFSIHPSLHNHAPDSPSERHGDKPAEPDSRAPGSGDDSDCPVCLWHAEAQEGLLRAAAAAALPLADSRLTWPRGRIPAFAYPAGAASPRGPPSRIAVA